ncbi:MAG: 4Fe-4S binding protein [Bacteroidales bacterium]
MTKKTNIARSILQYGVMALLLLAVIRSFFIDLRFDSAATSDEVHSFYNHLNNGNLAWSMTAVNLLLVVLLIVVIIFVGKLFCSYICPLGTISEFFGKIGQKLNVRFEAGKRTDKALRSLKYIFLFLTAYVALEASTLFSVEVDHNIAGIRLFNLDFSYITGGLILGVSVAGSVFSRLFWCKYLCPVGAISNIFRYFLLIVGLGAMYVILYSFNIHIPILLYIGLACLIGFIVEVVGSPLQKVNMLKVTRHELICTECGDCTQNCPQGIDVANETKVTHPDCNMCGDCVDACPETGALTINNIRIKWFPLILVSLLIIMVTIAGHRVEVPATEDYWGSGDHPEEAFFLSGLEQMECVNMARDYTRQFKDIDGVVGAATYLRSHSAKVIYNPEVTSEKEIRESFFIPIRTFIKEPPSHTDTIIVYKLGLDNNISSGEMDEISGLLESKPVYQLETQFSDELELLVFAGESVDDTTIVNRITDNRRTMYNVTGVDRSPVTISGLELNRRNFVEFRRFFNDASEVPRNQVEVVSFELTKYPRNRGQFHFLVNYVGRNNPNVIGLEVYYDTRPTADFFLIKDSMSPERLRDIVNVPEYEVEYTDGSQEVVENQYRFRLHDGITDYDPRIEHVRSTGHDTSMEHVSGTE